ncbi:cAMP-binding domain of CRP or a regulatory subunit of cAMP-dependent protein kinases [Chitinophaga eiseniae]|uniref:cAMP-binding domain of CRP or a regulatory subunit of cAMP-dependent protein kinases n=1 Tax=Chitinophaga eiseniae TaxID=634771 RepID=A0A1T4NBT6_9BACT|nr:Crp/Fnr family transcriptional regulator [Chitinophaga eiseniae]SJZ76704.1 cAMP-binding domain of CRP or a regulatory subunit of cAMP-dependent protein kinases [Chitinophaga eiseniae]
MQEKLRQHIEKIIPLSDEEFAFVLSHFTVKQAKKKTFLFRMGESVRYSYFVVSGLLTLIYHDDTGKQHIVSFAMEDWWESDYQAYFSQTAAGMSLQCLENTELYCLTLQDYRKLCSGLPKMEHFFLQKANAGHVGSQRRILSFLTSNAKERYEQLLQRYPALLQRVPKTLLASYLGVSRETLSRLGPSS